MPHENDECDMLIQLNGKIVKENMRDTRSRDPFDFFLQVKQGKTEITHSLLMKNYLWE